VTCKTVVVPGKLSAIVCGKFPKPQMCACGRPAPRLCDWKLGTDGQGKNPHKPITCDTPLCDAHTYQPQPDKDLCELHANRWKARLARAGAK
jgi:hypothetical protein